jgi:hypothetical protein
MRQRSDLAMKPVLYTAPQSPQESAGLLQTPADLDRLGGKSVMKSRNDTFFWWCHILSHLVTYQTPADSGRWSPDGLCPAVRVSVQVRVRLELGLG